MIKRDWLMVLLLLFISNNLVAKITHPVLVTPIDKALSFTQAKNNELIQLIKKIISNQPITSKLGIGLYYESPLLAKITTQLKNNQVVIQVNITNNHNYEWFIQKDDDLYVSLQGGKNIYHFTNSDFIPPGKGIAMIRKVSDDDYRLIRPNETLTFQQELSAEELYKNWRGQDIFIQYSVTGLPPSIADTYLQLYDNGKIDGVYSDDLVANQVRIRCYGYDKEHDQYQCDIDNNDHTKFR